MLVLATSAGLDDGSKHPSQVEPRHLVVEKYSRRNGASAKLESAVQTAQPVVAMVIAADVGRAYGHRFDH
jgi:hypothetical protein